MRNLSSLDKIRCEYESLEIDTSDVEKDGVSNYLKETIRLLDRNYKDINRAISADEGNKFFIQMMNPVLKAFGFEEKSSDFLDGDIAILRRFSSTTGLYKRMYQLLEFNMTEDNAIDIYRLSLLLCNKEQESTAYYYDLLKGIELSAQGILYLPTGSDDSSLVFDFFREELYGNILDENKGKVKGKK